MHSTERFSDRADDYVKYRPGYPDAVFDVIDQRVAERSSPRVAADIGSGTGIFTRGLLNHGWKVHAIEPNLEMRAAAELALKDHPGFVSHASQAEATGLPDASVQLITAAQAFHWFDPPKCRLEWRRILAPGGLVCLIWNVRQLGVPFMDAYEALLSRLLPEYRLVTQRRMDESILRQFFNGNCDTAHLSNGQSYDWDGFLGRALSSSYVPQSGHPLHESLLSALEKIFEEHQVGGQVLFCYETQMTFGWF